MRLSCSPPVWLLTIVLGMNSTLSALDCMFPPIPGPWLLLQPHYLAWPPSLSIAPANLPISHYSDIPWSVLLRGLYFGCSLSLEKSHPLHHSVYASWLSVSLLSRSFPWPTDFSTGPCLFDLTFSILSLHWISLVITHLTSNLSDIALPPLPAQTSKFHQSSSHGCFPPYHAFSTKHRTWPC